MLENMPNPVPGKYSCINASNNAIWRWNRTTAISILDFGLSYLRTHYVARRERRASTCARVRTAARFVAGAKGAKPNTSPWHTAVP